MNTTSRILILLVATLAFFGARAADDEERGPVREAGPNGGRVIDSVSPRVEFFVAEDRRVRLTFLDDSGAPIPPQEQTASLIGGDRMNPTRLSFAREGDALVSDASLPEGDTFPIMLEIKQSPGAKAARERFNYNAHTCPECGYAEYACVCDH